MPKVLICASTLTHINNFHLPYLKYFHDQGFEVHLAVPGQETAKYVDQFHSVPITKSLFSVENLKAALKLKRLIKSNNYDLIITHTTLAAFVSRLGVVFSGKRPLKVINTVHGYLFWNGCGFVKKLIYYIPELLLRRVTDCIVTMNDEDYITAQKLVKKGGLVVKVPGMGADAARFEPAADAEKLTARQELSIPEKAFVLVYAAEFSKRKNHMELIKAMPEIIKSKPDALLLLCGNGALQSDIEAEADKLGLRDHIRFMGWRGQMEQIYKACDCAVSTSKSEGLPFNIIEAQLCGLPVVASRIRGHTDLIEDGINGWLYPPGESKALAEAVTQIYHSTDLGKCQGGAARQSALKYALDIAYKENTQVYRRLSL